MQRIIKTNIIRLIPSIITFILKSISIIYLSYIGILINLPINMVKLSSHWLWEKPKTTLVMGQREQHRGVLTRKKSLLQLCFIFNPNNRFLVKKMLQWKVCIVFMCWKPLDIDHEINWTWRLTSKLTKVNTWDSNYSVAATNFICTKNRKGTIYKMKQILG
jgi:hypothetical protein